MKSNENTLSKCLFFTSNRLSNIMRKMADKTFGKLGISSSYVYLLIIVNQYDGITLTELSEKLSISPSTCTRFVDKLVSQDILRKEYEWKTAHIHLTNNGIEICEKIDDCVKELYENYSQILSYEFGENLTQQIYEACEKLEKKI